MLHHVILHFSDTKCYYLQTLSNTISVLSSVVEHYHPLSPTLDVILKPQNVISLVTHCLQLVYTLKLSPTETV